MPFDWLFDWFVRLVHPNYSTEFRQQIQSVFRLVHPNYLTGYGLRLVHPNYLTGYRQQIQRIVEHVDHYATAKNAEK